MSLRTALFGALLVIAGTMSANAQSKLIMAEEIGCVWCARWNEEISEIYPKTGEGRAAPLERMDIHMPYPPELEFASKLRFTPTFVLMIDNKEVSRLEGYPGEDFFWGVLGQMLEKASVGVSQ
ncbi:MAG: hypothetical protein V7695_05885 [Sulfitobacter sp.]